MPLVLFAWLIQVVVQVPVVVLRCEVTGDPQARVYELSRVGEGSRARWILSMRSRMAGTSPVRLPLPGAKPVVTPTQVALEYRTLNGGRDVRWMVGPSAARLDVHANFELEVNIEADLDPRVELMNTEGAITNLSCTILSDR